jgi:hypothetical protein
VDASAEAAEGQRTPPARPAVAARRRRATRTLGRLLAAVATSALVILVIVTVTGGFAIRAGPIYFSAHAWRGPLFVALAALGAAALWARDAFTDASTAAWLLLDEHAAACAIVLAAAAAGVGVAHGTYSASSSDASGYVSEARLIASTRLATEEPLARGVAWPNATWAFAPLGYRPGIDPGELVPTYPAGLPLVMATVRLLAGELAAYLVVPFLGAIAVLATYGVGARLHSRAAGVAAALLLATSPIVLFQIVQPMSDVAVTAWWTVALLFALTPVPNAPLAAGAAAGLAVLTRPNLLPLAAVIALATVNWPRLRHEDSEAATAPQARLRGEDSEARLRGHVDPPASARQAGLRGHVDAAASARQAGLRGHVDPAASARQAPTVERRLRPDRLVGFVAGITPAVGAQLLMQWRLYGSPLLSGYGAAADLYSLNNVTPNAAGYAQRLLHGETPALVLAVASLAVLGVTRGRSGNARPVKRAVVLATLAFAILVASYLPYGIFAEWSYLRFLLPAFPLMFVLIGAWFVNSLCRLPVATRTMLFLCALAAVAAVNVVRARQEQAFSMRRYESRYSLAGRYLASSLPANAVVVTSQHSGSARYYTNLPILRWDQLDVDLDLAMAALRAMGRHPVLLIENWEVPALAAKYPRSAHARLDWDSRAEFGEETRVFLYDPADRGMPRTWRADRVH